MNTIPEELKYSATHEWARHEGGNFVVIGITDHAQQLLGDMVFVELPEPGETIKTGDEIGVVESVKAASDVYSPISGEIIAVNTELAESPALVNSDPYGDGWLIKVKMEDTSEFDTLMSSEEYKEILTEE